MNIAHFSLKQLSYITQESKKRMELTKSLGGSRRKVDLGDIKKWALADVVQFGQVLPQYEKDLEELKELQNKQRHSLREIQSNMLKGTLINTLKSRSDMNVI